VRRAKVGGFRDYFDDEQVAAIEAMIAERLAPEMGYNAPASVTQDAKSAEA